MVLWFGARSAGGRPVVRSRQWLFDLRGAVGVGITEGNTSPRNH
jgi:hypothetical protein